MAFSEVQTQIALDNYLEDVKQLIISFYNILGLRASGNFGNRLIVQDNELIMPGYGRFIGDGTGSKGGSFNALEWMRQKGIQPREGRTDEQAAFLIERKVREEGTDIFQGKAGIPYEEIMDRALDKDFNDIADAIFFDTLDGAGFEKIAV